MKKKFIIGIVMLIALGGVVFGGGSPEKEETTATPSAAEIPNTLVDRNGEPKGDVKIFHSLGDSRIDYSPYNAGYRSDYVFIVEKSDSDLFYYDQNGNSITEPAITGFIDFLISSSGSSEEELYIRSGLGYDINFDAVYTEQSVSFSDEQKGLVEQYRSRDGFSFSLNRDYTNLDSTTILSLSDSGQLIRISGAIPRGFFPMERDILEKLVPGQSYENQALSFLWSVMQGNSDYADSIAVTFEGLIQEKYGISLNDLTTVSFESTENREYWNAFLNIFQSHFSTITEPDRTTYQNSIKLPYLSISESAFEALYNRNPVHLYIDVYLDLCFRLNRPVLSNKITGASSNAIPYNYSDLTPLTSDEGKRLAETALRYYTWGVENTPQQGGESVNNVFSQQDVYGDHQELVDNWIGNSGIDDRVAISNYLPADKSVGLVEGLVTSSSSDIVVQNGDFNTDTISLFGMLKSGQSFSLSHVDLWTAKNLAWEAGVIRDVHAGIGASSEQDDDVKSRLFDKKINEDGNPANNLVLNRDNATDKELSFGYTFASAQSVKALLIVKGEGDPAGDSKYGNYSSFDNSDGDHLQILVKTANDANEKSVDLSEITEYSYALYQNSSRVYRTQDSKVGHQFAMTHSHFNPEGSNVQTVTYLFYVFDEALEDVTDIRIANKNALAFLNIAEFGVFDDNPISYITEKEFTRDNANVMFRYYPSGLFESIDTLNGVNTSFGAFNDWFLFFNTNPELSLVLSDQTSQFSDLNSLICTFKDVLNLRQIVFRGDLSNDFLIDPVAINGKIDDLFGNGLMSPVAQLNYVGTLQQHNLLTSPFVEGAQVTPGNPLPFVQFGIDSPRTFAYKMAEQYKTRMWYRNSYPDDSFITEIITDKITTAARDSSGFSDPENGYLNEIGLAREKSVSLRINPSNSFQYTDLGTYLSSIPFKNGSEVLKPFIPGQSRFVDGTNNYDSFQLNSPDKLAGVDSLGLLSGALAMSGIKKQFLNAYNTEVPTVTNGYFSMSADSVQNQYVESNSTKKNISITGLDQAFTPSFYQRTSSNQIIDSVSRMQARFTNGDLERTTILVPDLELIQPGDLLVNNGTGGDPIIGIVVDVNWGSETNTSTWTPHDFMVNTLVLSVREGLNQVTVGAWGNPDGAFGGFTTTPEAFHVRRLVGLTGNSFAKKGTLEAWDVLEMDVPVKLRTTYPGTDRVPYVATNLPITVSASGDFNAALKKADTQFAKELQDGTLGRGRSKHYYYRELPTTSLQNKIDNTLFGNDLQMAVTQLSGWRNYIANPAYTSWELNYHMGVDFTERPNSSSRFSSDDGYDYTPGASFPKIPIYAPVDGKFFMWRPTEWKGAEALKVGGLAIGGEEEFKGTTYGFIGVLISNESDIAHRRIYLFGHLGDEANNDSEIDKDEKLGISEGRIFYEKLFTKDGGTYPDSEANAITVTESQLIGFMGNKGNVDQHLHMEIFEYFSGAWHRVDPLSVFNPALFRISIEEEAISSYGWWSRQYGNRELFRDRISLLLDRHSQGALEIADVLGINTFAPLTLDDADYLSPSSYSKWRYLQSSIYFYDLFTSAGGSLTDREKVAESRKVFAPDGWDPQRVLE